MQLLCLLLASVKIAASLASVEQSSTVKLPQLPEELRRRAESEEACEEEDFWAPVQDLCTLICGASLGFLAKHIALAPWGERSHSDVQLRKPSCHEERDCWGCTALHHAAHSNSPLQARKLLEQGFDSNARDAWDETPLHMAARRGDVETASVLLRLGADVDAANLDGKTPLVVAADEGHEEICGFLLDRGATVGGLEDKALPSLLSSILFQRMLKPRELPALLTSRTRTTTAKDC